MPISLICPYGVYITTEGTKYAHEPVGMSDKCDTITDPEEIRERYCRRCENIICDNPKSNA